MKQLFISILIITSFIGLAQAPQKISYQAVARQSSGLILPSQNIGVEFKIFQSSTSGTLVYSETHNTTTSSFGLFSLFIGGGSPSVGSFSSINWATGNYWVETLIDPTGGTSYSSVGAQQLMSVPYALYAETSGNANSTPTITGVGIASVTSTAGNSFTISVTTPTITGTGSATVTGTYPNFTINTPITAAAVTPTITGTGATIVSGTYPNLTINTPTTQVYTAGNGIDITSGVISNTAAAVSPTINSGGVANVTNSSTNVYLVDVPAPILNYNPGTNELTLTQNSSTSTATLNGTGSNTVSIVGSGIAAVTPTTGSNFTVSVPSPTFASNGPTTITGSYPSYTVNSAASFSTTLIQGSNVTLNQSGNTFTVSSITPTITGTGATTVTGTYPILTINTPTVSASTPTLIGTGVTSVTSSGNTFTINTPASTTYTNGAGISITSGSIITNSSPNQTVTMVGTGATTVTGIYPNYTINSPIVVAAITPTIVGGGIAVVTPTVGNNFTVSVPAQTVSIASGSLAISLGNSVALPTNSLSISSNSLTLNGLGGNTILLPSSILTPSTNITISGSAPNYTVSAVTPTIVGAGSAIVSGTYPNQTITVPVTTPQVLSIANNSVVSLSGGGGSINIIPSTLTYTAGTNTLKLTDGLSVNTITLNSASATTVSAGTNVGVTGSAPNFTISSITPTITGTGATTVTGTYPNLTINTPTTQAYTAGTGISVSSGIITNTSPNQTVTLNGTGASTVSGVYPNFTISSSSPTTAITGNGTGIATVTTSANNFTVNVSSPTYSANTGVLSFGGTNTIVVTPSLSLSGTTLTSGAATNSVNLSSLSGWSLLGNSGTIDGTHFIGTSDNKPFNIRVNGNKAGRIDHILSNVFMGAFAGNSTTGSFNSAFGHTALYSNVTGINNTALGNSALFSSTGSNNTSIGDASLYSTTSGSNNTAIGENSGFSNVVGSGNVFLGYQAGYNELGSNKLYIANNNTATPLLFGDFSSNRLGINGNPLTNARFVIYHTATIADPTINLIESTGNLNRIKFSNPSISTNFWEAGAQAALTPSNSAFSINHNEGAGYKSEFIVYGDGKVQIHNLNTALASLHVLDINNTTSNGIASEGFGQNGNIVITRTNYTGSLTAPTRSSILGGDVIGRLSFPGYAGTSYGSGPVMYAKAFDNFSGSANGSELFFGTIPSGSITTIDVLKLTQDGRVEVQKTLSIPSTGILNIANGQIAGKILTSDGVGNAIWQTSGAGSSPWIQSGAIATLSAGVTQVGIGTSTPNNVFQVKDYITFENTGSNTSLGYLTGTGVSPNDYYNTFVGYYAGQAVGTGGGSATGNSFVGYNSGQSNLNGANNTFVGLNSGKLNNSGNVNTFVGSYTGQSNTTGGNNSFFGSQAGLANTTGDSNTFLGNFSGQNNTTGRLNTFIGRGADLLSATQYTNAVAIGFNAKVDADDKVQIGSALVNYVQLGTASTTTLETGFVKITGGSPALGKVLTSNAAGLASWQTPSVGSSPWVQGVGTTTLANIGDKVGIGTNAPTSQLHVFGTSDPLQITLQNGGGNFKTGFNIKTALNEWFIGQESTSASGFRITDIGSSAVRFQIDPTGNVGIGNTAPIEKLEVNGNIQIPAINDYKYASAKTNYLNIPVNSLKSIDKSYDVTIFSYVGGSDGDAGYAYIDNGGSAGTKAIATTPVFLPDGAVVTELFVRYYDGDATYNGTFSLERKGINTIVNQTMASYTSSGSGSGPASAALQSITAIANNPIDNANFSYYFKFKTTQLNSNIGILDIRITYTVVKAN